MPLTKEDILKFIPAEFAAGNEDIENEEALYNKSDVLKAMDEYAKQQSIAFARYIIIDVFKMNSISGSPYVSEDHVYNQFLKKQQNKDNDKTTI